MKKLLTLFFFLILAGSISATHNRAGEITFRHLSGLTYEITIHTYTKASSVQADRDELTLKFGDGTEELVRRSNGPIINGAHQGQIISGRDIKINRYITTHTFAGPGEYTLSMQDPNRNAGVLNIPNSVNTIFYIETILVIPSFGQFDFNNSPVLQNPPIDNGCVGRTFDHDPGAVDPEGDSLSYELVESLGDTGGVIVNFVQPNMVDPGPNNTLTLDPVSGLLVWTSPQRQGEYNVAFLIIEWRRLSDGSYIKVGETMRDMQITIGNCENLPPEIDEQETVCVEVGENFSRIIRAVDPDRFDRIQLTATGQPLDFGNNPALFPQPTSGQDSVKQSLSWTPNCNQVRYQPYKIVFRAEDDSPDVQLVDYKSLFIQVIAPAPQNPEADPIGNSIELNWDQSICNNAIGYRIYRRIDSIGYVPPECVTGVPASTGYSFLAEVPDVNITTYLDDNNGNGLVHGQRYSYMVYAEFADGSKSYPSEEFTAKLLKDVPVITRVSVNSTDVVNGSDTITWAKPTDLDPTQWQEPFQYKYYRSAQLNQFTLIGESAPANDVFALDTVFVDNNLNTQDIQYTYRIELVSGPEEDVVGSTQPATSPFLKSEPLDNRVRLTWDINVPWTNKQFVIFRETNPGSGNFELLDTTSNDFYMDSNLINGEEYCYRITTVGEYSTTGFINPILNHSQELCEIPSDAQSPCPPTLTMQSDCEAYTNDLRWTNPNVQCDTVDDVVEYRIYYTPTQNGDFELIASQQGATDTNRIFTDLESVAGCYYVTAVDSFQNESKPSNIICVDNCPVYELPNIITPGGDGFNDLFEPFPYRFVESIELSIFNRWGTEVFSTTDPNIKWDGLDQNSGTMVSDGVYFYVCTVNEIRLSGIIPRVLKGSVTVMSQIKRSPGN